MVVATVKFDKHLRPWDGFGFNYVAAFQTHDFEARPQDYGSLGTLSETARREVIEAVFGDSGLQVTCGKLFIDPWGTGNSQLKPSGMPEDQWTVDFDKYDFGWTTTWQRYFWKEGLKLVGERGDEFSMLATLYCPPGWMTVQKQLRSRDLDMACKHELAKYLVAYVKYMRESEGLPVRGLSFFNEGEIDCRNRWPDDGRLDLSVEHGDYDMLWPIEQAVDFLKVARPMLDRYGFDDVRLAYGECTILNWATKYSEAVAGDPEAMRCLGMFGSHGFGDSIYCFTDEPLRALRKCKSDLRGWVTSDTFGNMNINFPIRLHRHVYMSQVNAVIPWAGIQRHSQWRGGDPNPGTAIAIRDDGTYELTRGYYLYKHFTRAGKAGMAVADVFVDSDDIMISAFAPNGTRHPESFVVINRNIEPRSVKLTVEGATGSVFSVVQSDDSKSYQQVGEVPVESGAMRFTVPPMSVSTFSA